MNQISFGQKVSAAPETMINEVGGEAVLLNLKSECYYGLDDVGTSMWKALTSGGTIEEAYRSLMDEFEVDGEQLRRDFLALIEKLSEQELIEIND